LNNRLNVAVTGFVGSGSSAVVDLLKEFDICECALERDTEYEHIPFYSQGGLFELGAILLNLSSPHNSDMAINRFIEGAHRLNDNDFGWFGSYKGYLSDKYIKAMNEFVDSISNKVEGKTFEHVIKTKFSLFKVLLQVGAIILYKRPVQKWGRVYVYDKKPVYYSMPTEDEFYAAARKLINDYFNMCASPNKQVMVYNHLIWPQHSKLIDNYFGDNFKTIIVVRDARDLFTLNKHYWYKPPVGNGSPLFPTDPNEFVEYWKRVNRYDKMTSNKKILYVHFEDLIYNYEQTVSEIRNFVGLKEEQHVSKRKFFNPDKSIKNTQTFSVNEKWIQEALTIEEKMAEHVYRFPYEITTSLSEMFNDPLYTTTTLKK